MATNFFWSAQGLQDDEYGDGRHGAAASGTVGARSVDAAKQDVTQTLKKRGFTVITLDVTPID
jgi:hypothetical protein